MAAFAELRAAMVEQQLRGRGIADERVLAAMGRVARERFVPAGLRARAYDDGALAIGNGQTISQPWIVAAICQALVLRGGEHVLEVGSGSGYSAAVLAELGARVISIELVPALAERARTALAALGYEPGQVEVRTGDGSLGLSERAPFEAIAVHAAAPGPPRTLLGQLAIGGRLVVPLAERDEEALTLFTRRPAGTPAARRRIAPCRFVPLLGAEGFGAHGR